MEPRISFITLGVSDLVNSTRYYRDVLGLEVHKAYDNVTFFEFGKTWFALFPRELLAEDAGVPCTGTVPASGGTFPGFSLAHNVKSPEEVDALLAVAATGGGKLIKAGHKAFWGGYTGYFADPDGYLWEVAWNPDFPHV